MTNYPFRSMWRLLAAGIIGAVLWASPAHAKTRPSKACLKALDAAETLQIGYESLGMLQNDLVQAIAQRLTSTVDFATALNGVTSEITAASPRVQATRASLEDMDDDFRAAAKRCRAGK